jgi:hypothetical protein
MFGRIRLNDETTMSAGQVVRNYISRYTFYNATSKYTIDFISVSYLGTGNYGWPCSLPEHFVNPLKNLTAKTIKEGAGNKKI